ncbi:hypothetical protein O4H49_03750 [Kiloniella laminariae]|uniref:Uncharacterized protein n=1 Tax=Kiloniella laminariae TaxID=454162 RepID=A0ABT4LFJ2_9PROT|nr:hypothetical protein [Kiloniella laminariae]MCZ4279878.1 hypothetical protein [Kiloniella laminariae]
MEQQDANRKAAEQAGDVYALQVIWRFVGPEAIAADRVQAPVCFLRGLSGLNGPAGESLKHSVEQKPGKIRQQNNFARDDPRRDSSQPAVVTSKFKIMMAGGGQNPEDDLSQDTSLLAGAVLALALRAALNEAGTGERDTGVGGTEETDTARVNPDGLLADLLDPDLAHGRYQGTKALVQLQFHAASKVLLVAQILPPVSVVKG